MIMGDWGPRVTRIPHDHGIAATKARRVLLAGLESSVGDDVGGSDGCQSGADRGCADLGWQVTTFWLPKLAGAMISQMIMDMDVPRPRGRLT
jgi:hypothetical protein